MRNINIHHFQTKRFLSLFSLELDENCKTICELRTLINLGLSQIAKTRREIVQYISPNYTELLAYTSEIRR